MKITFYGHASLSIETNGKFLIVDPYISPNPKASHIDINSLKADYMLLTHGHGDHVADVEAIAKRTGAIIVSNAEITSYYGDKGFNTHPLNHGGSKQFDFGKLKFVNAIHSSTLPDGTPAGNPGGFVIEADKNIYIAGDTALTYDMKLIPLRTKLDLAIFPIGDNYTMDAEDAAIASDFVGCDRVMGYHYDTFGYIVIDKAAAQKTFRDKGKTLMLPEIGEEVEV